MWAFPTGIFLRVFDEVDLSFFLSLLLVWGCGGLGWVGLGGVDVLVETGGG